MPIDEQAAINDETVQLVVFRLAGESYGLDIGSIDTIIRMQEITEIPRTPEFVEGVINLRGSIIPVIDLRKRFQLDVKEETKASRIIVVRVAEQAIGIVVDAVLETTKLPSSAIEPISQIASSVDTQYVRGIGKIDDRIIILLDINKVLSNKESSALKSINQQKVDAD